MLSKNAKKKKKKWLQLLIEVILFVYFVSLLVKHVSSLDFWYI